MTYAERGRAKGRTTEEEREGQLEIRIRNEREVDGIWISSFISSPLIFFFARRPTGEIFCSLRNPVGAGAKCRTMV